MQLHEVRVHPEADRLPRHEQLAWKIAEVAADPVAVTPEAAEMIGSRIIETQPSPSPPSIVARSRPRERRPWRIRARAVRQCSAARRTAGACRVGGLGERDRGTRAGLPRHVPRRRIQPSGRQHPADFGSGAAMRPRRRCAVARRWPPGTIFRSTWCARSRCTGTRSTTWRIWVRPSPPASGRCWACRSRPRTRRSSRRCM